MTLIRLRFKPKCSVYHQLVFAEEDGSIANSGRWLQWHWQAADAPGEARNDGQILTGILYKIRELYEKEGGQGQDL